MTIKNWVWDPLKLTLTSDVIYVTEKKNVSWFSGDLLIADGVWTVIKNFTWNGTTAVPDGPNLSDASHVPVQSSTGKVPITWKASLIHDIGIKYVMYPNFPYTRAEVDWMFKLLLDECNFKYAWLYYIGVRIASIIKGLL